jgi:hypothetical protein
LRHSGCARGIDQKMPCRRWARGLLGSEPSCRAVATTIAQPQTMFVRANRLNPIATGFSMPGNVPPSKRSIVGPAAVSAGVLSLAALGLRGLSETGSASAPLNAVSHVLWGDEALRRDDPSVDHTLVGGAVHLGSGLVWAALYGWVRQRRRQPTALNSVTDAIVVSAVAAAVDFRLTPHRLTPGFEHRLSRPGLVWVYGAFAAGLALSGIRSQRGHSRPLRE